MFGLSDKFLQGSLLLVVSQGRADGQMMFDHSNDEIDENSPAYSFYPVLAASKFCETHQQTSSDRGASSIRINE